DDSEDLYHLDESTDVRKRFADVERVFLGDANAAPRAMVLVEREKPIPARVLLRGDPVRPGSVVPRRFPALLKEVWSGVVSKGSGRLELARAVASPKNPLTVRVIVNRVWAWHFGCGLVATPSDFGVRSDAPSHPELLDYLSARFVESGWSIKELHRLIVRSSVWKQSSRDRAEAIELDPENRLLWRFSRTRRDFESMRDSLLEVSGRLDRRRFGRPSNETPSDPSATRRSVYLLVDRERLPGVFRVFDFPSPDISSPERPSTSVPQQALFFLNSKFAIDCARRIARGTRALKGPARVRELFRRILGRDSTPAEVALAARFVNARQPNVESPTNSAWRYGYAGLGEGAKLGNYRDLPFFSGAAWQGGDRYPDRKLQWIQLTARGGHAGVDHRHAVVRRWIAPRTGEVSIAGSLSHGVEDCGDGVRGRVISSGRVLGEWSVYKSREKTTVAKLTVKEGDDVSFVVDCRKEHTCDVFEWAPVVTYSDGARERFSAEEDFGRVVKRVGSAWAELAHALLQSNEFLFVD
ncbi:MAG: DUF1553 domain-containing protein, partial [Planctomycetota bacterium]